MSKEVKTDKNRFSKAEAQYLLDRPWLTTDSQRKGLQKMLAPKAEEPEDETEGENEE